MAATNDNNYYRHPKTRQEIKATFDEDAKGLIRGKRSKGRLPNAWDDIPRSERAEKSWKSRRKEQQHLDKNAKFYHIEISHNSGYNSSIYSCTRNIEEHLEKLDYSYKRMYKMIDGNLICIIEYRGHHIGDWPGARYL